MFGSLVKFSTNGKGGEPSAHIMPGNSKPNMTGSSVICDDCGRVFGVSYEIVSGNYSRKRCDRCAARVSEEKAAHSPHARKCSTCQTVFGVSARIAELPADVTVNCLRCSDTHRLLVQNGTYLEVTLQKGEDKLYICCPKSLQGEIKKCLAQSKQQGYCVMPGTLPDAGLGEP